jgi:hypothetical protein
LGEISPNLVTLAESHSAPPKINSPKINSPKINSPKINSKKKTFSGDVPIVDTFTYEQPRSRIQVAIHTGVAHWSTYHFPVSYSKAYQNIHKLGFLV